MRTSPQKQRKLKPYSIFSLACVSILLGLWLLGCSGGAQQGSSVVVVAPPQSLTQPAGGWIALTLGSGQVCATGQDQITACARPDAQTIARFPNLTHVSASAGRLCGLDMENKIPRCVSLQNPNGVHAPIPSAPADLSALALGQSHACGLRASGAVWCWGSNGFGQLGDGTLTDRDVPAPAHGLENIVALTAADNHTCALKSDGVVWCWGSNTFGQLGDGTTASRPVAVASFALPAQAVAISTQADQTCALLNDQSVWCWGSASLERPKRIPLPPDDFVQITSGQQFSCARAAGGEVWCWGIVQWTGCDLCASVYPAAVAGLEDAAWIAAAADGQMACALRTNGDIVCWGADALGLVSGRFWEPALGQ